ncbi:hypothetical protein GDO86_008813, partial [Hymenochirus boettgeri]
VNELINALEICIKAHKGQISKLAPQLQAEQEQGSTYVYQHIKDLSTNVIFPKGIHLKVFKNGTDTGGALIYISHKELQGSLDFDQKDSMKELLQTIQERLHSSFEFNVLGLRPSRIFSEKGQEIKNPQSLEDNQKIWVSYGEDYREVGMILSRAMPQICLAIGQAIELRNENGSLEQGYRLELQQSDVSHFFQQQLSNPLVLPTLPEGGLGEPRQLTVALVRKMGENHPEASAQRWAIKHEGTAKPGQWKVSTVENPLWNKLTYLWPVLQNGDINENFDWPIQGSLIPKSPPMQKPKTDSPNGCTPVRLKVLRNGDFDSNTACLVVGPNLTNMLKRQCTAIMNLPSAARRLFNENGAEIFRLRDLERDQLVYVSCGDAWLNPQISAMEHKKHILAKNFASDMVLIRSFCSLRMPDNLVLEVSGNLIEGVKLLINHRVSTINEEQREKVEEETKSEEAEDVVQENEQDEFLSRQWQRDHLQQFEYLDGQIISCAFPGLAVGVTSAEVHAGVEVVLVGRNPEDINQRWKYKAGSRTFHLASKTDLVLAISMPKNYSPHINGAANQKWNYIADAKVLSSFYSDQLDIDITAANQASVCTFCITGKQEISQPGHHFRLSEDNEPIMTCISCSRTVRGRQDMTKVEAGNVFFCGSGQKNSYLNPKGPFSYLHVSKLDLSSSKAINTLTYLEETHKNLVLELLPATQTPDISPDGSVRALKIKAYKNGSGFKNGKLVITKSISMLLQLATTELDLPRPASKVYTVDGAVIRTMSALKAWVLNDFIKKIKEQRTYETINTDNDNDGNLVKETSEIILVTPENINNVDESLLSFVIRNPIEVWVSCGESFLSPSDVRRSEKQGKIQWLQKGKILTDLEMLKHKMRHLQGRRVKSLTPPSMVRTVSPAQPVLVKGGWTEETMEETKLLENIKDVEANLVNTQCPAQKQDCLVVTGKTDNKRKLYDHPALKRVLVYLNGGNSEQAIFAWGQNLEELLESSTCRLNMNHPAEALYTPDGKPATSWDDITRDSLLCASAGEPFISKRASRQKIEVRANYARMRKNYGPDATDVVISPSNFFYPK